MDERRREYSANIRECQGEKGKVSEASNLSGVVAHNLSGLGWLLLEVADETDRVATGDPSDAI